MKGKVPAFVFLLLMLMLVFCIPIWGANQDEPIIEPQAPEGLGEEVQEELMGDMELEAIQDVVTEILGEDAFSIRDAINSLLSGEEPLTVKSLLDIGGRMIVGQLAQQKKIIVNVMILVLLAALLTNFASVFENSQIGEISFYLVYMLLFTLLIQSFGSISKEIHQSLSYTVNFMQVLTPAYFLAVIAASGAGSATVFYEMVLLLIYVVQKLLQSIILPGINIYVLLELVNYLHKEDFLSKMAELVKMLVEWTLKTCLTCVVGLQIVQGMVTPVIDSLKRTIIGKTAGAIPGVGNIIDGVTEVVLGTSVLVRNCLGVVAIIVLVCICLAPLIRLGIVTVMYKFLAALTQPISDKRMVGCLNTVGEGCLLLFRVLATTEILFIITIAVLATSFFAHT